MQNILKTQEYLITMSSKQNVWLNNKLTANLIYFSPFFIFSSTQLAVWSCASQRGASCHSPHPWLLPVNSDLWPLYSQVQYCHDVRPSTDNNTNEEGEGGGLGGYTAVHIVYPQKDLFKHLAKTMSVCLRMDQKVCAITITIFIAEDLHWKSPHYVKQQWCLNSSSCTRLAGLMAPRLKVKICSFKCGCLNQAVCHGLYLGVRNMICMHFCKSKEM